MWIRMIVISVLSRISRQKGQYRPWKRWDGGAGSARAKPSVGPRHATGQRPGRPPRQRNRSNCQRGCPIPGSPATGWLPRAATRQRVTALLREAERASVGRFAYVHVLNGDKMEDVIFAGTSGKPPLNMAEVNLTLENDNGSAPEELREYAEIMLTRRLYRSGESASVLIIAVTKSVRYYFVVIFCSFSFA